LRADPELRYWPEEEKNPDPRFDIEAEDRCIPEKALRCLPLLPAKWPMLLAWDLLL
jgi:hypothetical protein